MLPPLASLEDLQARLPETIGDVDEPRAEAALQDASALVRAEAGTTWTTNGELDADVPDIIVTVTLAVARRAYLNPEEARQATIGGYSVTYGPGGTFLTEDEKQLVASIASKQTGLWTIDTTRADNDVPDIYLRTSGGGDLMVHVPKGEPW